MPNPGKKINNAPQNAQTDTGTGSPQRVYQKIEKKATPIATQKATPIMQQKATPRNAQTDTGTGGGKTMMKKLKKSVTEGASETGATRMKKLTPTGQTMMKKLKKAATEGAQEGAASVSATRKATPIATRKATPISQSETDTTTRPGAVNSVARDPFVEGFNSNDTSFASRYRRYRRNRGDNRRQTK